MNDFTELAAAVERKREGKTELWPQNDDAVIVREVPRLIERLERAESALERAREDRDSHDRARRYEMGRRDRAEGELYRLAEALLNYGECKGWCESGYGPGRACTCGWVLLARESVGEVHALYAEVAALTAERDRLADALGQACANLALYSPDRTREDDGLGYQTRLWKAALLAGWGGPLGFPFEDEAIAGEEQT